MTDDFTRQEESTGAQWVNIQYHHKLYIVIDLFKKSALWRSLQLNTIILELCAGARVPEPESENSGKNSGRQNYEKLFHISMNIWY
jgi:hypothetical protein